MSRPDHLVLVTGTGTEVGKTWVTARLAEATDAVLVTETFFERLSQRETDIFYGVMIVDFDISLGLQLEIE